MSNLAFHNDPALAELVRGQVAAHAAAAYAARIRQADKFVELLEAAE